MVISQFEFLERDNLTHPLLSRARRIGMNVETAWHLRLCFARHDPFRVVIFVAVVVERHEIGDQDVTRLRIQPADGHFEGRKHSPR